MKYRKKEIVNEPSDQKELRLALAFQTMMTDKELMRKRAESQDISIKEVDNEMKSIIEKQYSEALGRSLLELWYEEAKKGENSIKEEWQKKLEWQKGKESDTLMFKKTKKKNSPQNTTAITDEEDIDSDSQIDVSNTDSNPYRRDSQERPVHERLGNQQTDNSNQQNSAQPNTSHNRNKNSYQDTEGNNLYFRRGQARGRGRGKAKSSKIPK